MHSIISVWHWLPGRQQQMGVSAQVIGSGDEPSICRCDKPCHHPVSQRALPTSPGMNPDDGRGDICELDTRRLGPMPTRARTMIHERVERTIPNVRLCQLFS